MKKALVVLLALTCLSAMAFADDVAWTFGATVKTGAVITVNSEGDPGIAVNDADDTVASRVRFDAEAALGDFAAHVRVGGDGAGNTVGTTFLNAWWVNAYFMDKMIQLQFGNLDHSVTDTVNKGWGGLSVEGAQLVVAPISGLSIGLAIPAVTTKGNLNEALAGIKVGLSYTMADLLTLKTTYMNQGQQYYVNGATAVYVDETLTLVSGNAKNNSDFAIGVDVLAVPNLKAQVEVNMLNIGMKDSVFVANPTTSTLTGIITGSTELFENFEYTMGPLVPGIELDQMLWTDKDFGSEKTKTGLSFKPKVQYTVMTGTDIGISVAYALNTMNIADAVAGGDGWTDALVADPWVKFTFNDKAKLKIDAAYTIPDLSDTSVWMIPININFMYSY